MALTRIALPAVEENFSPRGCSITARVYTERKRQMPTLPANTNETDATEWLGRCRGDPAVLAEALALPAEHLTGLPLETRFILEGHGIAHEIVWSTGVITEPRRTGQLVYGAAEVHALVLGVQAERLWSSDLKGFCLRKLHDPSFQVTEGLALGGAQPELRASWSLDRVLRWLDLELVGVELGRRRGPTRTKLLSRPRLIRRRRRAPRRQPASRRQADRAGHRPPIHVPSR